MKNKIEENKDFNKYRNKYVRNMKSYLNKYYIYFKFKYFFKELNVSGNRQINRPAEISGRNFGFYRP